MNRKEKRLKKEIKIKDFRTRQAHKELRKQGEYIDVINECSQIESSKNLDVDIENTKMRKPKLKKSKFINKKYQPIMKNRINILLEKIENKKK